MVKILIFLLLFPSLAFSQCVTEKEAIDTLEIMIKEVEGETRMGTRVNTTECNPCKCPISGMAACYEYMAEQERTREKEYTRRRNILDRLKQEGICK